MTLTVRLLLGFALCTAPNAAQLLTDTMIADINADPAVVGSFNGGFASDGARVWFSAIDGVSGEGYRIWNTDGTPAGTVQLTSLALLVYESVLLPGGDLFLVADELGHGVALWRSDGTQAGTAQVFAPQPWTAPPRDVTVFGNAVWFLAGQEATGVELWKHDLVSGTTALALELAPGPASGAGDLFACAGSLLVAGPGHTPLFATDGTPGSVVEVASFAFPSDGTYRQVAHARGRAVFNVAGFGGDAGWWASDGTPSGTQHLSATFNDLWAVEAATRVYFTAGGVASTPLLWETDGTPAGTLPVDLPTTTGGQRVGLALDAVAGIAIGDELFYSGLVPGVGFELCRANGAAGGAELAADVHPSGNSDPDDFTLFGGEIFFRATDGAHGREIWRFDPAATTGTPAQLVVDMFPGPLAAIVGSSPTLLSASSGVVYGQNFLTLGIEPAVTDGVAAGLLLNIGDEGASAGSDPKHFARLGSRVLFQAFDGATGAELWSTDGSAAGTHLVADIDPAVSGFPGAFGSFPHHLVTWGDRVYFFASHPDTGKELWSSDGTSAGTALVADLVPGPGSVEPLFSAPPVALGDALYFIGREAGGAFALYRSDGTSAGTSHVITTDPSGLFTEIVKLARVNDRLLFAERGPEGAEVWSSDGTAAGTGVLVDMNPGPASSFLVQIAAGDTWAALSVSIGSASTLWRTDGTAAGTQLLFDVVPGPQSSGAFGFTAAADRAYFAVQSPPGSGHFGELWLTDATSAGTQLVAALPSPLAGAGVGDLWAPHADGGILFTNVDANGEEWWVSDGTLAGTTPLTDSAPGPKFASPTPGALVSNRLVFAAKDGLNGRELHALPLAATGGWAVTSLGSGCSGSNGVPELALASGAPVAGGAIVLGLANAQPAGTAVWAFDDVYVGPPAIGACALQLAAPFLLGATAVDGAGASTLAAPLPAAPSLAGLALDVQALSVDVGGPFLGVGALSNVLEFVLGP